MAIVPPAPGSDPDPTDIQGNLVGFNKDHVRLTFITFPNATAGKAFLQAMIPEIATVDEVLAFNAAYKVIAAKSPSITKIDAVWLNVLLSATGLTVINASEMTQMPAEFTQGMAAQSVELGDTASSDPSVWLPPFNQGAPAPVHAMVILAADDSDDLADAYAELQAKITAAQVTEITPAQDGNTRPGAERGHEHFGFKDGISQPGIVGITESSKGGDSIATGEFIIGYPDQDGNTSGQGQPGQPIPQGQQGYPGSTPATPTLPPWTANGSFVCYRRLRQDVGAFQAFVTAPNPPGGLASDALGAKLLGRWASGAPMEPVPDLPAGIDPSTADPSAATPAVLDDDQINAFDYAGDASGNMVPIASHIRRSYPRSGNPDGLAESNRHRILRRGIPYGPEFQPGEAPYGQTPVDDNRDRGLLFLCYQSSLARGFMFAQASWANNPDFAQAGAGVDPVIGQTSAPRVFNLTPQGIHLTVAQWVTTTGGEFFFSPSISGLTQLVQS